jgi:hypothetical protein
MTKEAHLKITKELLGAKNPLDLLLKPEQEELEMPVPSIRTGLTPGEQYAQNKFDTQ